MLLNALIRKTIFKQSRLIISLKQKTTNAAIDIDKLDAEGTANVVNVTDEESNEREDKLELRRNKSRLNPSDYNKLHGKVPYPNPVHWSHGTLKYQQKMYGIYGEASGFDPSYCWPTQQELRRRISQESVAYPYTIQEAAQTARAVREEREEQIWKRQREIEKRIEKLDVWKNELHSRIAKKEKEALNAKSRKDRLVEEVRRHFGYTVDPKSDKFKEMLEKKEKEQKKVMKEAKRKVKEDKMLGKITEGLENNDQKLIAKLAKQDYT